MEGPTFWDNPDEAQKTIQKVKTLNAVLKPFEELVSAKGDMDAMVELCDEDSSLEPDLTVEVDKVGSMLDAFEFQAMMSGKQDANNAILSIKPGAGGTDACDWAQTLMRMYIRWAERHGFSVEIQDEVPNEEAGIQSVTMRIVGEYAYGHMQSEVGVHRLVRISPFGGGDTRQTSFAAVEVLPEIDDTIEIEVRDCDLIMQTFCSGGPGGQHQNKTQSGVRLIHTPTNVRAESRTERSQPKNYNNALALLKARLYAIEEQKRLGDIANRYDGKGEIAFGSQIRSYIVHPYTLVREERDGIDLKTPDLAGVLDGDLDPFMQAYLRHKVERAHKASLKA
ncbi:peptide chain release factor 2 : Bacterial peptide chain release factor 2 (BRF-2) OS=Isosphaera pallida (strain ATCC 43644 / DSM 9630 / IS1B) GN=Isop_2193 PE=4 SV=1: PCRF: RF-1 [Tuwongella immobilis]|uniref:Peptide chain release factor 2 n=2 Tax=Tuwongella immobilis TaxID=692036 RepID=A0A6C2YMX1_9BACT|nr:peptide chain release factor 2 : Bacterial peptide chain release factor 2 (BRF-2) OS=Isosphaera pallida (strain ATCC 43644 / DSM 9630 / IS1B) GN=Isop_2193 PE=4 SV=1: PCRF: RF-1 [Tuwongella immobilis]VTS02446.1 peptide chain release factor 2 : Bacterial peptide chain release factor 2 (BRF-2) OS=Isosphaera pallida (strain ATCC 43644 / DSM 9630 / IS1B) GN=Isop_2193 PE=4 SV=1: PCRF: RF-1 [Tuwongella immobilis]